MAAVDAPRVRVFASAGVLLLGVLATVFVPASHLLKHVLLDTPRLTHQAVLELVVASSPPGELILGTWDRMLMPFAGRMWEDSTAPKASIAQVLPHTVVFDLTLGGRYTDKLRCVLAEHSNSVLWGVERGVVRALDRVAGTAELSVPLYEATFLTARLDAITVVYEVEDALYLRGRVERIGFVSAGVEEAPNPLACRP